MYAFIGDLHLCAGKIPQMDVEPIPVLIEYVRDKYDIDVSKEVEDYKHRINRDEDA